jgi:hypothetical protein
MRSPRWSRNRAGLRVVLLCAVVSSGAAACSSNAEGSGDKSVGVTISQDEVTIENLTGTSLSKGEVSIIPQGFARPYLANLAYMTSGSKRSIPLNSFRMSDGSPFRRDVTNGKSVKVTAKDVSGKTYEREVPFN